MNETLAKDQEAWDFHTISDHPDYAIGSMLRGRDALAEETLK